MPHQYQTTAATLIHKVIRHELFAVAQRLAKASPEDSAAVLQVINEIAALLHGHGAQEDKLLEPQLRLVNPALANQLREDHQELEQLLRKILVQAEDLEPSRPELCGVALARLYRDWNQFVGHYLLHLHDEEQTLFPALGADALPVKMVAQSAVAQEPSQRQAFLQKLQRALNPTEYQLLDAQIAAGLRQYSA